MKKIISAIVFLSLVFTLTFSQSSFFSSAEPAITIDGVRDEVYEQNGFEFEMYPIEKDQTSWRHIMGDHLPNTANIAASGSYTFDSEWVYVYVECKQPEAFPIGERGLFANCSIHANAKPSIANYPDDGINPADTQKDGDYKNPDKGFQRMNINNLEQACTSEADSIFGDAVFDARTKWFSTWFRNEQNDREGIAVKRTSDNKGYGVEFKWKRDTEETSAMFSVGFRFSSASGLRYMMATGGGEMYNYQGMIRVYFDESVDAPIKIDGVKDQAYNAGNHVELKLEEAYPVSFPDPDEDLTATAYMRWDRQYIYTCIVANYNRPMILPPDNQHINKPLLNEDKVDYISFGFDANPEETCSIVTGNRAENIWFAMSPAGWAQWSEEPYVFIDNLAALFCSPNQTSPRANAFHLGGYQFDFWQRPNLATTLSEDKKTFTLEVRVRRDLKSKDFNCSFVVNMANSDGSGSRVKRSSGAQRPEMRSGFMLLTYADYTEQIIDKNSGVSYKDINEILPVDTAISVTPVTSGTDYDKAVERAGENGKVISVNKVAFMDGSTELTQLDNQIGIGLPLPEGREDELDLMVYDTVNNQIMDITLIEKQMYFYTNKPSTYAIIDMNPTAPAGPTDPTDPTDSTDPTDPTDPGEDDDDENKNGGPSTGEDSIPAIGLIALISGLVFVSAGKGSKRK